MINRKKNSPTKNREFFLLLLLGLCLSLFIHFFVLKNIVHIEIASFNPSSFDHIVPRKFHLERVTIDPNLLKEPQKPAPLLHPVNIPLKEESFLKSKEEEKSVISYEKPNSLNIPEIDEGKKEVISDLITKTLQKPNQPSISFSDSSSSEGSSLKDLITNQSSGQGNYSQLDELINKKEPLSSKTAPILLPTDLLFEYDADRLKPEAEKSLEKLAVLIQRNPNAEFIIEGFTDSFGSEEYNLDLSTRRAESIKKWLITSNLVNEKQIQSKGLGKSHFIVPSTGNIQEQRLNRRVEIVIHQ